ncbi:MAG: exo-beta-N-acetylmuramidase NamZ domain-containing protein [Candidatus Acidiferrales bacterium]
MRHNLTSRRVFPWRFIEVPFLAVLISAGAAVQGRPTAQAGSHTGANLSSLDSIVQDAIRHDEIPGAVLLVSHNRRIIYRKAFGSRALIPHREAMTADTIFDLASLTKILATTVSVMKLMEEGKLRINDPVARYLPEFVSHGKDQITLRMLLTHTAGLVPDPPLDVAQGGNDALWKEICGEELLAPPGTRFIYSDTGFIVLGKLIERISGQPLDRYAAESIFKPLKMNHTRFLPPPDWIAQIAPTEEVGLAEGAQPGSGRGRVLRGVVHDPTARAMGGVAGHAGLFSTADDLAIFCQMMLEEGRVPMPDGAPRDKRIFAAATIHRMTTPENPPWVPSLRGYGWDIDSAYSAPRGELFPVGSYGHTGFTGTSVWIDPQSQTLVILLASSVHPYRRPAISSLRSKVATAVATALNIGARQGIPSAVERSAGTDRPYGVMGILKQSDHTKTGIDVLEEAQFAPLRGKRVGLIANQTGVDSQGRRTIDVLAKAQDVKLVALFSPEHGIEGRADAKVMSGTDPTTNLPIYSLYGETPRPTDEMLRGIDALVFDIQDAGVRFYTFTTTMAYAMEEAAKRHISFYVLDRPNPLGGEAIEGPMLDKDRASFVGYFPMPVRYAMTLGELAQMFNAENKIGADLRVIAMQDWRRRDTFEATGDVWILPSPNLRTLNATLLYPGIEILQAGGVSVGRGTDTPFELFGAPWIRGPELAEALNRRFVPGVRFVPTRFTPRDAMYKGEDCQGISLIITDRASLHSMLMGLEIASVLWGMYPDHFAIDKLIELVGNENTVERLKKGDVPARIVEDWEPEIEAFRKIRAKYLLYP